MRPFKLVVFVSLVWLIANAALAAKPEFQAPYSCGQEWRFTTYNIPDDPSTANDESKKHGNFAIDAVQHDGTNVIGDRQPTRASAPGTIVFDYTWPSGDKQGERWIFIDHKDGWRTQYVHLAEQPNKPRFKIGRKVAMGEIIGITSNSGVTGVHLHYTQRNNVSRDAASLKARADAGEWDKVLGDGEEKRIEFNDKKIDTYLANTPVVKTDTSAGIPEFVSSYNCAGGSFTQWRDSGENLILRYNPRNGNVRINQIAPTSNDNPNVFNATWDKTWNTFVPYKTLSNHSFLFRYSFATGDVKFFEVDVVNGSGVEEIGSVKKYAGWSEIVPIKLKGVSHAIFYDTRFGYFNVDEIDSYDPGFISRLKTRVKAGFTHLAPYVEGSDHYVFMYKGGNGLMTIEKLTRRTNKSVTNQTVWQQKRRANWTHITLLEDAGTPHILAYDAVTGDAKIFKIKPNGAGVESTSDFLDWQPGWTATTPYENNGNAFVLLYRATDGLSRKVKMKSDGSGFVNKTTKTWAKGYR